MKKRKTLITLGFFITLITSSIYFALDFYLEKISSEFLKNWLSAEAISIQEGNLLVSISKGQRILLSSQFVKGISVIDDSNQNGNFDTLADFGSLIEVHPNDLPDNSGEIIIKSRAFFNKYILYRFPNREFITVIFNVAPPITKWIFFIFSTLMAIIIIAFNFLIKRERDRELQSKIKISQLAAQVAHDIRSPLAALNMAIRDISNIQEDKRIIIRGSVSRIQDIANDLLAKHRESKSVENKPSTVSKEPLTNQLISSLLDCIITEKRMQFRSKLGIEIEFCSGANSYGLFAKIRSHEFKRVISNIINNSVEALGETGKVLIELTGINEKIEIKIKDNGKGIPPDILAKLGKQGESHGKEKGNGLGLFHAKRSIESWNGELLFESIVGVGTTLTIQLPKDAAPSWFVPELKLVENGSIVILDDDSTIHQIWDRRFDEIKLKDYKSNVFHFSTSDQVVEWVENNKSNSAVVYLFDFELIGQKSNGLALIEKLGLEKKAILVTSRCEEKAILEKCQYLGVKLIPKSMAESVPISIIPSLKETGTGPLPLPSTSFSASAIYDVVYIDDDKYLRIGWEKSAKAKGIKLLTLSSTKDFDQYSSTLSRETTFYIDRELGENEPKGEVWAKELFEKGYTNLFLATGYDKSYFPPMEWISGFIEKAPPWEEESDW